MDTNQVMVSVGRDICTVGIVGIAIGGMESMAMGYIY